MPSCTARSRLDSSPKSLTRRWRAVPDGLDLITDEETPIGFWRRALCELHRNQLPRGS
jgi:hypothetical protein